MCEHANENPLVCRCPKNCSCYKYMHKENRKKVISHKTDGKAKTIMPDGFLFNRPQPGDTVEVTFFGKLWYAVTVKWVSVDSFRWDRHRQSKEVNIPKGELAFDSHKLYWRWPKETVGN